jgi:DUF438 domain-containing protein
MSSNASGRSAALGEEARRMKEGLKPEHVIHRMIQEHEALLELLDRLEVTNRAIQARDAFVAGRPEFEELARIAQTLLHAEQHHQVEEDVLFPEMEKRGLVRPTRIMRMEHEEFQERKEELESLAESAGEGDFEGFKSSLDGVVRVLTLALRNHIHEEGSILYPMALQAIPDERIWRRMEQESERIGRCPFITGLE